MNFRSFPFFPSLPKKVFLTKIVNCHLCMQRGLESSRMNQEKNTCATSTPYVYTLFENYSKCRIWIFFILAFPTNFCPIKTDLSGNTFWPQASGFQKLDHGPFLAFLINFCSIQTVNVARFARNVEWYFFCDFQTPKIVFITIFPWCFLYNFWSTHSLDLNV